MSIDSCKTPTVNDTQSAYWLEINRDWHLLQGVAPVASIRDSRPRSELITIDGSRWVQKTQKRLREWEFTLQWATPLTVRLLQLAAQTSGPVRLYDEAAACANILDPQYTQGDDAWWRINCGEIRLRSLVKQVAYTPDLPDPPTQTFVLPTGEYLLSGWTTAPSATTILDGSKDGVPFQVKAPAGTAPNPRRFSYLLSNPGNTTEISLTPRRPSGSGELIGGLMLQRVFDGQTSPKSPWIIGQKASTLVSVEDLSQSREYREPGTFGRQNWSVKILEVG